VEEKTRQAIKIDLSQFKLHIHLKHKTELTLHFDSPSRMFYLAVIALVVNEMKRLGKITSIPLQAHSDLLALLNETIGGTAGSSDSEHLIPRIYRKWKDALPDLENGPLFKVIGRKKELENGVGKTYQFTESEKDLWANLFEYRGSHENVRLKFSIDKLGAGLDDIVIIYEGYQNEEAWEKFISGLRQKEGKKPEHVEIVPQESKTPATPSRKEKVRLLKRWQWAALAIVLIVAALAIWRAYFYSPSGRVASVEKMAFPLPNEPSIAVLPFVNMTDDPKQEFFSDGITEEIITALSKVRHLFVISRQSTFYYKGKPVKVKQVSEELGVRYVLEGSVRKEGDRVRITTQLIDAVRGHHLWADRYDRKLKSIFALQDEITLKIVNALQVKLTEGERARMWAKGTNSLDAYMKQIEAQENLHRFNKENYALARQLAKEAIDIDPQFASAYMSLGKAYMTEVALQISSSPKQSIVKAIEFTQKAIAIDESHGEARALLGFLYTLTGEYEKGVEEAQKAINLSPNSDLAHQYLGFCLRFAGKPKEAIPVLKRAIRLNPFTPSIILFNLGLSYLFSGQYEEAITECKRATTREPNNLGAHLALTVAYSVSGRNEEARAAATEVLRIEPKFSIEYFSKTIVYKNQADRDRFIEALRKAGLK
jgi:TolB-like protein/lipopolysaccharide biosynthesis regulator YciM